MSVLPDSNTAPAWLSGNDESYADWSLRDTISPEELGPWTPLRTAEDWVKRIDRDALAVEIALTPDPSHAGMGTRHVGMDWAREMADAVLAALPELMGGESDE